MKGKRETTAGGGVGQLGEFTQAFTPRSSPLVLRKASNWREIQLDRTLDK
ncbi:hypothetical protein [Bacillus weihaiensis]|nr:hypothetical protein [Bacillus weihaiensis]